MQCNLPQLELMYTYLKCDLNYHLVKHCHNCKLGFGLTMDSSVHYMASSDPALKKNPPSSFFFNLMMRLIHKHADLTKFYFTMLSTQLNNSATGLSSMASVFPPGMPALLPHL